MKKLLMVILMASIVTPAFAFADNDKSEREGENEVKNSAPVAQATHFEKSETEDSYKGSNYNSDDADMEDDEDVDEDEDDGYTAPQATSTVDTTAPILSLIGASAITQNKATISWTTNEVATGVIYVSATSPLIEASSTVLNLATLATAHSFDITSLVANTKYYYVVKSADFAGNVATSPEYNFTTASSTSLLAISNLVASNIASTTATVSWITNIPATGSLYFGTSTPPTSTLSAITPTTTHVFNLVGLIANTTYNYIAQAIDAANNIVLSLTKSFTTTQ